MGLQVASNLYSSPIFTQQLSLEDTWLVEEVCESLKRRNIDYRLIESYGDDMILFWTRTFGILGHYIAIDSAEKSPFTIHLTKATQEVRSITFKTCEALTSYIKFLQN